MNVKVFIGFLLVAALVSCKSKQIKISDVDLETYCTNAIKKGLIEKAPLILLDAKPIGLLSEIDMENFEFKTINSNSLSVIPKGSEYLKRIWGEDSKNGVIEITKFKTLHCGTPPKWIYLLNDQEVSFETIKSLRGKDIKYWTRIDDIVDSEKNDLVIDIIITNNKSN